MMRMACASRRFLVGFSLAMSLLLIGVSLPTVGLRSELFAQNRQGQGKKKKPNKPVEPPLPVPERKVVVTKVDPETRVKVKSSAAHIDSLIEKNYAKYKVTPNAPLTDEQFVRRVYLTITGRIPTYKQVRTFVIQKDADRHSRLIDTLLNTDDYSSSFYNYWADILRLNERLTNNVPGRPFNEYVRVSLETNKPYDKWVYEMLTAEGKIWDHPEVGYILRDTGMPLDAMNNTIRIFLGTQIGCAQCHDHPNDKWTQHEFYEMAAFTFGTQPRVNPGDKKFGGGNVVKRLQEELKKVDEKFDGGGKYNRMLQGNLFEVHDSPRPLKLPADYQYTDAKPGAVVAPQTIFDPPAEIKKGEPPRIAFARWLTSRENPRFAKTIANRLWKRAFGAGQIEPVDGMRDDTVAENPALMDFLTAEMIRVNFDLKEYLRIILNTKTFQRQASSAEINLAEPYHFPGPILRRMTAEQAWDSFITLAVHKPDEYQIEPAKVQTQFLNVNLATATAQEVFERDKQLREATSGKMRDARNKNYTYKGLLLVRASELPQPVPPSHFLRQFGQSDRESIEASSTEGSVPQALQMFNGPITHMLLEEKSLMYETVMAAKTPEDRVDVIFQTILSRKSIPEERQAALAEIKQHGNAGYGNVIWALVNTHEYLFIQ
ncbi:MAG: hypothetical protein JWN70_499 [Planctomycetaceae bacterium]|nr:hypothetical protein [Planctomycetaceae bacterium]